MKRKMILKRITSFVCAMMVMIGAVGGAVSYKADLVIDYSGMYSVDFASKDVSSSYTVDVSTFPCDVEDRDWIIVKSESGKKNFFLFVFNENESWEPYYESVAGVRRYYYYNFNESSVDLYYSSDLLTWGNTSPAGYNFCTYDTTSYEWGLGNCLFVASTCSIHVGGVEIYSATHGDGGGNIPDVTGDVGFLWGINHEIAYARGKYYNYNEDSRTDRWTYDKYSTAGIDLLAGGYSVKHYVRPVLVNGYEDEDVVEKYEKIYDALYDASLGYIQYLDKELESKLVGQGYDGPSWIDKYILGRFVLRWHYFELVDNETGRSDGFVRLRQKDADNINGGTEYWIEAVDENDNIIEGYEAHVGYIGEGTYVESEDEDIEDAFDDAEDDIEEQEDHTNIANLDGVSIFASVMESFADSTANFSAVIGNFFNCLPPWVLTVFGLSVALTFLAFIIKNLR